MLTATATEFKQQFSEYQRKVRREPIQVVNHGEPTGYFLSPEDFAEFQRLRSSVREHLTPGALSDEDREALRSSRVPAEYAHLNSLMDD